MILLLCEQYFTFHFSLINSALYQEHEFFLTITGSTSPCPIMVISTTIVAIKIMVLRIGNGMPLSANLGSPIAIANDTMPRMPDQLMIRHSRMDSNASSAIFLFFALYPLCKLRRCKKILIIRISNATIVMRNA